MKTILINIGILAGIVLAYWLDIFSWFVGRGATFVALVLVAGVFVAGWRILGNPFSGAKHHDDE